VNAPFLIPSLLIVVLSVPLAFGLVPPNRFYGVRTAATLADPAAWYAVNRTGGMALILAGVAYLGALVALPTYDPLQFGTFVAHLVAFAGPIALGVGASLAMAPRSS
jgi:uncharacterized membrane protein